MLRSLFAVFSLCLASTVSATAPPVKQSKSGVCHDQTSSFYNRTKTFVAFETLQQCIEHGGRLPKGASKLVDKATEEALAENRSFSTLYNRKEWPHWIDDDNDCQNTRHELLIQTSSTPVTFKSSKDCTVVRGQWYDPYSAETFTTAKDLDLDHIVPLHFAHGHGGGKWSRELKRSFANDPENLLLVKASLNRQKGAKGPDQWLPPNHAYRCEYISHFMYIIKKYNDLSLIPSELRTVNRMTKACNKD